MSDLIRRAWWTRKVAGKPQVSRVHLFPIERTTGKPIRTALCGVSISRSAFDLNDKNAGIVEFAAGDSSANPRCLRCLATAATRKEDA